MREKSYRRLSGLGCAGTLAATLVFSGCASVPPPEPPKIERITGAELEARLPAHPANISLDEIVALSKKGQTPAQIIEKLDTTHSLHQLTASQLAALLKQGVHPQVLDHIMETERRRLFDDIAADISRRERACQDRLEQEARQHQLQSMQPIQPYWPAQPFAGCWPPHAGFPFWRCF